MTLQDLMNIQVGKRYLFKNTPTETRCEDCGAIGTCSEFYQEFEVTIIRKAEGGIKCGHCGSLSSLSCEGWYRVSPIDRPDDEGIAPYTQLHRIEEEDYD